MNAMKIVIGYDGTPASEAAIADLRRAALPEVLECSVLMVSEAWIPHEQEKAALAATHHDAVLSASGGAPVGQDLHEPSVASKGQLENHGVAELLDAQAHVEQVAERLVRSFPGWTIRAEARPDGAVWGLLDRVREWNADLVIVGTHERSAMGRIIHGSVEQSLLVDAPSSVRIARAPWTNKPAGLRVVAALDGSHDAEATLKELARRNWPAGSAVHLVSAYDPILVPGSGYFGMVVGTKDFDDDDLRARYDQIARARERLESAGLTVTSSVRLDDPVALIIEEASRWGADAIFLGARGHRMAERFLLGSVSSTVARRAHCSVEVVRPWKQVEL
jgi:nucleotide-binding universal stress UspA family protein